MYTTEVVHYVCNEALDFKLRNNKSNCKRKCGLFCIQIVRLSNYKYEVSYALSRSFSSEWGSQYGILLI